MRSIVTLVILLSLASPAFAADAPPDPCSKTEQECLAQVLAERLVQAEMQNIRNEAHERFKPPSPPTTNQ